MLGPLRVWSRECPVDLGPARQRAVLSALLLTPGQAMAPDRLKETVWPRKPPGAAMANLQSYVSNLRRTLEPNSPPWYRNRILRRDPSGYVLDVESEVVDACRFERLLREGRRLLHEGEHRCASRTLEECLSLWSGSPYQEVRDSEAGAQAAARLEELRLLAMESRWEAELALGRDSSVIAADVAALRMRFPTRERLSWLLMQALYRSGRRAEALRIYHQTRTLLADEYGVDPGLELQELFGSILRGATDVSRAAPGLVR
ncbi:AfsR/SARP family transcriptional regulator [Streptomyces johnsoniae]|uniref:AfsR/SARP family transcriptional regulator n=1 Tax=Streptomyces johnsoniae TaxID=3075532 RepID=A0ABU2S0U9_9ACTN|nr:AfsR/SARP family transcriptional regulator [Streptomyces sp. DSM 41886]MDT0442570.1 AfsR/SARP family transcriptional regulator [Streptomyces sp. DSM 41886]